MLALFALGGGTLVWSTLSDQERAAVTQLLGDRVALLVMVALVPGGGRCGRGAAAVPALVRRTGAAARAGAGAAEHRRAVAELSAAGAAAPLQGLARAFNELAQQRDRLRLDMAQQVALASRGIEQERCRLAALMSELTQSVVVCNLDGRVLLYNNRARLQFRRCRTRPALAGGAELIGLGRSIYAVFDRQLVAHALESVQQRLQRGAATPSAQFVTVTKSGQLLRAQMAPVRDERGRRRATWAASC